MSADSHEPTKQDAPELGVLVGSTFPWILIPFVLAVFVFAFGRVVGFDHWSAGDDRDYVVWAESWFGHSPTQVPFGERHPIRPVWDAAILVGYFLFGPNPVAFRITQLLLHLAASGFAVYALRRLGYSRELSFLAGFLFLINVSHFRVLHWIVCTHYILTFVSNLATLLWFDMALRRRRSIYQIGCVAAIAVGAMTHPSAVSVVPFCIYLAWRRMGVSWSAVRVCIPLLLTAIVAGTAMYLISPNTTQAEGMARAPEMSRVLTNVPWYMSRLITSAHWLPQSLDLSGMQPWEIVLGVLALAAVAVCIVRRIEPYGTFGIWAVASILPFFNNDIDRLWFGPSRHLYPASLGVAVILASLIIKGTAFWRTAHYRNLAVGVTVAILTASSVLSLRRAEALSVYLSGRGYFVEASSRPRSLGIALGLFERAVKMDASIVPLDVYLRATLAAFSVGESSLELLEAGQLQYPSDPLLDAMVAAHGYQIADSSSWAVADSLVAEARDRSGKGAANHIAMLLNNLARDAVIRGKPDEAQMLLVRALKHNPRHTNSILNLCDVYLTKRDFDSAYALMNPLAKDEPGNVPAIERMGTIYLFTGRHDSARISYERVLEAEPDNPRAKYGLDFARRTRTGSSSSSAAGQKPLD